MKRQEISDEVWNQNYRAPGERNLTSTWKRQAEAAASVEKGKNKEAVYNDFLWLLSDFKGIAGGRITANLGVKGREGTTLMNCFTHNPGDIEYKDPDSIQGIYDMLKKQAITLKSEGGYGMNFSWIRPAGMYVRGIGSRTPGVLQFMSLWNQSSAVITMGSDKILGEKQSDEKKKIRKGAQMGILEIWHPEIEEFIDAKLVQGRLDKFNLSVGVTSGFMDAVVNDKNWKLVYPDTTVPEYTDGTWNGNIATWKEKGLPVTTYKTLKARDLWDKIMKATYTRNDPGILFLDMANELNPFEYGEHIATTNPCVTGDTIVAVADGRGDRTIKELADAGKDVPVYCEDSNGKLAIRMMRNPRITGYDQDIYEVTLEGGHKVRATGNHKFMTTTGEYKEVLDLEVGDGLKMMHKLDAAFRDVMPQVGQRPWKDYKWMKYNGSSAVAEHRMIYTFHNGTIPNGYVIHHKDFNQQNNHISNLQCMSKADHDRLHGDVMMGENNPMIKWYQNASDEEKQRYHDNMSASVSAEGNGRYSGVTNEELYSHALNLTRTNGRMFTNDLWVEYAKEHNLPQHFSGWRVNHLGGITGMAKKAAHELGLLPTANASEKVLQVYYDAVGQGYDAEIIDNSVYVNKVCEHCGVEFKATYQRREHGVCSSECGFRTYVNDKHDTIKSAQIDIFNRLKFEIGNDPKKSEWVDRCRLESVSPEISRKSSPFKSWSELKEAAATFNHRIVSIEHVGKDVVYNGTVDDFHNFFVGGFEEVSEYGKTQISYCANRNCGEIAMSTGVCNLMSLNLVKYITKNEDGKFEFDYETFKRAISIAVRFSDNINDISRVPLDEYKKSMTEKRRIGIGVLGLGSLHYMLGIRYGSQESIDLITSIMRTKSETEIISSALLGKEKGSFDSFDASKYFDSYWWKNLKISDDVKEKVQSIGCMRNSHRSANAPTGNMSIYAGVVSGGIEPVFMKEYVRWSIVPEQDRAKLKAAGLQFPDIHKGEWFETDVFKSTKRGTDDVLKGTFDGVDYEIDRNRGLVKATVVTDYGWDFVNANFTSEQISEMDSRGVFATTEDLGVDDHINTLKAIAHYTDMNSSKTINLPEDYSYEQFKNLYLDAWKSGIKGITTYRAGTMTAVLEKKEETQEKQEELENVFSEANGDVILEDVHLPDEYYSKGYIIRDHNRKKWYVNIAFSDHSHRKPFALFVNTNSKETTEVADDTIHAMMGLAKQVGIKKRLIDDQLEKYQGQTNVTKIARSIGFLLRHNVQLIDIVDILDGGNYPLSSFTFHIKRLLKQFIEDGTEVSGENGKCPNCGGKMVFQEGCILCVDCSWSKCG